MSQCCHPPPLGHLFNLFRSDIEKDNAEKTVTPGLYFEPVKMK